MVIVFGVGFGLGPGRVTWGEEEVEACLFSLDTYFPKLPPSFSQVVTLSCITFHSKSSRMFV